MVTNQFFESPNDLCKFVNSTLGVEIIDIVYNNSGYVLFYKYNNEKV